MASNLTLLTRRSGFGDGESDVGRRLAGEHITRTRINVNRWVLEDFEPSLAGACGLGTNARRGTHIHVDILEETCCSAA